MLLDVVIIKNIIQKGIVIRIVQSFSATGIAAVTDSARLCYLIEFAITLATAIAIITFCLL